MTFRATERMARKAHRCLFCEREIAAGTRYIDGFCIREGEPWPWRSHLVCQDIANHSIFAEYDEGVPPFSDWNPDDIAELPEKQRIALGNITGDAQ